MILNDKNGNTHSKRMTLKYYSEQLVKKIPRLILGCESVAELEQALG